jgi:ribosomal-protein-alanine N-acetyltransferase
MDRDALGAMNEDPTLPIASHSLLLRCFALEDAAKAFAMSQEEGMRAWLPDQVYENEAAALGVLQDLIGMCRDPGMPARAPYVLGVCRRDSLELIGHVGLSPLRGQVEIGFAIEDRYQGRGYASEAVRTMLDWAFPRFSLSRVLGIVASDNTASCGVLQRAGFELAGEAEGSLHGRMRLIKTYHRLR